MVARTPTVLAAGVVLWRPARGGVEIAVVHRPKYDDWSLPKGKREAGEHLLATAVRETLEETGHRVRLGRPLPQQRYPVAGATKLVHYWAARAESLAAPWLAGTLAGAPTDAGPGIAEIDRLEFLSVPAALERLTHPRDAELVENFAADPAPTTPLVLLRHAKATPRAKWTSADAQRPLAQAGTSQSLRLAVLLSCYGPTRVVSSDARRCLQTVRPYATTGRVFVEEDPRLSEDGHEADPDGAADAMREVVESGLPAVVCSHRPVLPVLLAAGGMQSQVALPKRPLAAGAFLVLHLRGGVVVAIERHSSEP